MICVRIRTAVHRPMLCPVRSALVPWADLLGEIIDYAYFGLCSTFILQMRTLKLPS